MNEPRPVRVQLSRKKGWRMPSNTIKVSRPSVFGNPFKCYRSLADAGEKQWSQDEAVTLFRKWIEGVDVVPDTGTETYRPSVDEIRAELRGKNLACWCKPGTPCHADVLLAIANDPVA